MATFPDAKKIFTERAIQRRIEFRRIKKQFEKFANVDKIAEIEGKEDLSQDKFAIHWYSDKSGPDACPPYLIDPDYYFDKTDLAEIPYEELEATSDSELQTRQTQEDLERKQRDSTNRSLDFLLVSSPLFPLTN